MRDRACRCSNDFRSVEIRLSNQPRLSRSGNDKLAVSIGANSQNSISGNDGNDEIKLKGGRVSSDEIIDGGAGFDTLIVEQSHDNALTLTNFENIIFTCSNNLTKETEREKS